MSIFTKKTNPFLGNAWWFQDEEYDFHQEIAHCGFADMLHDTERNQKYYAGIRLAITKMHKMGKKAHVLDIGTGTGLLSMMAVKCGADTVVACEVFPPMAECAKKIIHANGFADKIKVISKRSTDLRVGKNNDMEQHANILVTEVFNTELIGEGAIGTFTHAHKELLEKDCIVVPASGTLYAQVVESKLAMKWNKLDVVIDNEKCTNTLLEIPSTVRNCPGSTSLQDLQLSQFPQDQFCTIIAPYPVLRFDWSGKTPFPRYRSDVQILKSERDGIAQAVFMWWELNMDTEGQILLSCAPVWAHPLRSHLQSDKLPWRDHWMQAIYYLPQEVEVKQSEEVALISSHDEYSLWFTLWKDLSVVGNDSYRAGCECGLHAGFSRTRIGCMNDPIRRRKYIAALKNSVTQDSVCLCLSEGSLLGLIAAKLGAKKVYCCETIEMSKDLLEAFVHHNNLQDKVTILGKVEKMASEDVLNEVSVVLGEPFFSMALVPWHNIRFWFMKQRLSKFLRNGICILPAEATIWVMAVEFENLWKIRAPLHTVEGFVVSDFDKLIENARSITESNVEAQPLWEYECRALSHPVQILEFTFTEELIEKAVERRGIISCEGSGICHGLALWVDWDLDGNPKHKISTGPIEAVHFNENIKWDMYSHQGVCFMSVPQPISKSSCIHYSVKFQPYEEEIQFRFEIETES